MTYLTQISQNHTQQALRLTVLIVEKKSIISLTVSFTFVGHIEASEFK